MGVNNDLIVLSGNVIHTSDKDLGGNTIASVVITGIAVVFIALILLIILVWLYGKIFDAVNKKAEEKAAAEKAQAEKEKPAAKTASVPASALVVADGIEEEVVAVITAAVEAYGAQTGKKLAVRGIRPSAGNEPGCRNAWSAAGLAEATRPF